MLADRIVFLVTVIGSSLALLLTDPPPPGSYSERSSQQVRETSAPAAVVPCGRAG